MSEPLRRIKVTVESYLQSDNGGEDLLEDRSVVESRNLSIPSIIKMRSPLIDVQKAWNEGDSDQT